MKSTMRPIHSLIEAKLLNRTQNIQSLTTSLHSRLSNELRHHCWVVDVIGNTLILITDNAERATILRYQQHELVKQINEEFGHTLTTRIRRLKIKIDYNLTKLSCGVVKSPSRDDEVINQAKHHCQQMLNLLNKSDTN